MTTEERLRMQRDAELKAAEFMARLSLVLGAISFACSVGSIVFYCLTWR